MENYNANRAWQETHAPRSNDRLHQLYRDEFDEQLSAFHADQIVDLFLATLGPAVYNQAVQDVRAHLQSKLDDLDGEVYVDTSVSL